MLKRSPLGYIEIERPRPWWSRIWWTVFMVCLLYFVVHLFFWGIDRHMAIKETTGFSFSGQDSSSGHRYYIERHERGR